MRVLSIDQHSSAVVHDHRIAARLGKCLGFDDEDSPGRDHDVVEVEAIGRNVVDHLGAERP